MKSDCFGFWVDGGIEALTNESQHDETNKMTYETNEDSERKSDLTKA